MPTVIERLRDPFSGITQRELAAEVARITVEDILRHERDRGIYGSFSRHYRQPRPRIIRLDQSVFRGMNAGIGFPPVSATAVTASATETNLWLPAQWTPIPALSMRQGSKYELNAGGIFTSTATPGVLTWTYRVGISATPATNISLGASNLTAPPASLTNAPWFALGVAGVRSFGLAGNTTVMVGHCFVHVQGAAAATAVDYLAGGLTTATTIDYTATQGLILSLTISVASQSYQAEYALLDAA